MQKDESATGIAYSVSKAKDMLKILFGYAAGILSHQAKGNHLLVNACIHLSQKLPAVFQLH